MKPSAITQAVYRPFGGGRRKSLAYILKGRAAIVYDHQDLTTMYQDAQGTLPVYRPGTGLVDPPVGLMLDKSEGLELGPELWPETFTLATADPSGGVSVYNETTGEISVTTAGTAAYYPRLAKGLVGASALSSSKFYRMRVKFSGDLSRLTAVTFLGNSGAGVFNDGGASGDAIRASGGEFEWIGKPVASFLYIYLDGRTTWSGLFLNSISIREIKGYHAYQPTTTARPTLSGRYNLLTATETLSTQSVTTVATNYTL
ncbi:MAG: hypothetical protein EOM52_12675, partial [Clostridia bacterium]|nr:hypothetical protein [Clostridia bacterium]